MKQFAVVAGHNQKLEPQLIIYFYYCVTFIIYLGRAPFGDYITRITIRILRCRIQLYAVLLSHRSPLININ